MTHQKNRILHSLKAVRQASTMPIYFLYQGWCAGRLLKHFEKVLASFIKACKFFSDTIHQETCRCAKVNDKNFAHLRDTTVKLHEALPADSRFSYSILIPVYHPKEEYLRKAVLSALRQTASDLEVLVGFDGPQPTKVYEVIKDLQEKYPKQLKAFSLDRGGISTTTNYLAKQAKGNFLILMDHDDWILPNLLYHYEQALRSSDNPENKVLYCDEFLIDERDFSIPHHHSNKNPHPHFPYFFINSVCHCMLFSKQLWNRTGGLRKECDGAQDYDLALQLNLIGAEFENIPFHLYGWRTHAQSTAHNSQAKPYATKGGLKALNDYCQLRQLDWHIIEGYLPTTYRAIPSLKGIPKVHVIIPFEGDSELTLQTIHSVQMQEGVSTHITVIGSRVSSTTKTEIRKLNVIVMSFDAPYHLSKFYNKAVRETEGTELILFLKSGIKLEKDALLEMCRWIVQPNIGIVGCRLNDTQGLLYHGGVEHKQDYPMTQRSWRYIEQRLPFNHLTIAKELRVTHAVSEHCALIQRKHFLQIGGFDEMGSSDLNNDDIQLSLKLSQNGLLSLYTPYASATYTTRINDV